MHYITEQRNGHSNSNHIFESVRPHTTNSISSSLQNLHHRQHSPIASRSLSSEFDTALRYSSGSRLLHGANDVIFANDLNYQPFNQPQTRKITKITPSMFILE